MKNYEKYKELVISCIAKDSVCDLGHKAFEEKSCYDRTCKECAAFIVEWLNRECPRIDWEKVSVDTPVLIECEKGTMRRHFAGYLQGHVLVYMNGQTSWTNNGKTYPCKPEDVKFARDADFTKYAK